jgi:hypothetical protein
MLLGVALLLQALCLDSRKPLQTTAILWALVLPVVPPQESTSAAGIALLEAGLALGGSKGIALVAAAAGLSGLALLPAMLLGLGWVLWREPVKNWWGLVFLALSVFKLPDLPHQLYDLSQVWTPTALETALLDLRYMPILLLLCIFAGIQQPPSRHFWARLLLSLLLLGLTQPAASYPTLALAPTLATCACSLKLPAPLLLFAGLAGFWFPDPPPREPKITQDRPDQQALYVWMDGTIQGPLITPASSADIHQKNGVWTVYFVREQQLYCSNSQDGLDWESPSSLGIMGFDPAWIEDESGNEWLFVAEMDALKKDPAQAPTRIMRYLLVEGKALQGQVMVEGQGLVDPAPRKTKDRWELLLTRLPMQLVRAVSEDGLRWTLEEQPLHLDIGVASWDGEDLIVQKHQAGKPMLFRLEQGQLQGLGIEGTGPSVWEGRIYFTRSGLAGW